MAEFTRRQFATTLAFAALGATSGRLVAGMPRPLGDRSLDVTFHGLWVIYRKSGKITAYAFADPDKEHCFVAAWFNNDLPQVKCLPTGSIAFNHLQPLGSGIPVQAFDTNKNICLACNCDPADLLQSARVAISLPQWPAAINSLRPASMQDIGNNPHPGSILQRLTYSFKSADPDPSFGDSSLGWTPNWSAGNANIHFFAEPDKEVDNDHAVRALNDVVTRILGLEGPEFSRVYEPASPGNFPPQDKCLSELKIKCPCPGTPQPVARATPVNVANCMGIIVP